MGRVWQREGPAWHSAGPGCQSVPWDGGLRVGTGSLARARIPRQAGRVTDGCVSVSECPAVAGRASPGGA